MAKGRRLNLNEREEKNKNFWLIKSDKDLKKAMDDLRRIRFINGLDTRLVPYNDILHASFRYPPLLDILKKAEFKEKEEGKK